VTAVGPLSPPGTRVGVRGAALSIDRNPSPRFLSRSKSDLSLVETSAKEVAIRREV